MAAYSELDFNSNSSSSEDEEVLLLTLLLRRNRRRRRANCRKQWVKTWIQRRHAKGAYSNLIQELNAEDPEKFRQFHRLDWHSFEEVLALVGPIITKQDNRMRSSISPSERLSVTLRYMATGETFRRLSFQFRMGERTISGIVEETSIAIYNALKEIFLKTPSTEEEWRVVADEFKLKWNYPCCLGATDGKHIAIRQPSDSGSEFFNYKHFFSVLFLALVDANYKFLYVDAGAAGRRCVQ